MACEYYDENKNTNAPLVNYEGHKVSAWVICPAGHKAHLDSTGSYPAYRCSYCYAILGSAGCGCTYDQEE